MDQPRCRWNHTAILSKQRPAKVRATALRTRLSLLQHVCYSIFARKLNMKIQVCTTCVKLLREAYDLSNLDYSGSGICEHCGKERLLVVCDAQKRKKRENDMS